MSTFFGIPTRQRSLSGQLTWQASPRNKLALRLERDGLDAENHDVGAWVPVESSTSLGISVLSQLAGRLSFDLVNQFLNVDLNGRITHVVGGCFLHILFLVFVDFNFDFQFCCR